MRNPLVCMTAVSGIANEHA